jgi:hypothetical protein
MRALGMEPKAQWKGRRCACNGYVGYFDNAIISTTKPKPTTITAAKPESTDLKASTSLVN